MARHLFYKIIFITEIAELCPLRSYHQLFHSESAKTFALIPIEPGEPAPHVRSNIFLICLSEPVCKQLIKNWPSVCFSPLWFFVDFLCGSPMSGPGCQSNYLDIFVPARTQPLLMRSHSGLNIIPHHCLPLPLSWQ